MLANSLKKNLKDFISIKTSAVIPPIRPISVLRGGIPYSTIDNSVDIYEKCQGFFFINNF